MFDVVQSGVLRVGAALVQPCMHAITMLFQHQVQPIKQWTEVPLIE